MPFATCSMAMLRSRFVRAARRRALPTGVAGAASCHLPSWCAEWKHRYPEAGIAIALGPASGIVGLDLDHDVDGLHARILEAAGPSPVGKRGARGATYFYRHSGERSRAFARDGQTVAEILSQGRLVILPPTIHPGTGQPYEWVTPQRLLNRDAATLPPLNAAGVAGLFEQGKPPPRRREAPARRPADADRLAEALRHIPADDYHRLDSGGHGAQSRPGRRRVCAVG